VNNTIIYLLGHYGVGKLTVAKAICAATGARLFDNHLINNVVFSLIPADGKTPLPEQVWDTIGIIREVAFDAIKALAPPDCSYVLTNALTDDPVDRHWFDRAVALAAHRKSRFLPVVLQCDEAAHAFRIDTPERAANLKHTDVASGLVRRTTVRLLPVDHPHKLVLDTTHLPPKAAAATIIAAAERLPE
jgi:hypothetical protein